jgi:hypothetical protein
MECPFPRLCQPASAALRGLSAFAGIVTRQHDTTLENVDGNEFIDVSSGMGEDFLRMGCQPDSAFVDLDDGGFVGLVVTSLNQAPRIPLNSAANGGHWLLMKLVGVKCNRDATGAKLKVTTPSGRLLYNHVTGSVGSMSTSDLRAHFGLGGEASAATIEIQWPSGDTKTLRDVAADQILRLEEPH